MPHKLKISISNPYGKTANASLRERLLYRLFGNPHKVTIIVPGDSIRNLSIERVPETKTP